MEFVILDAKTKKLITEADFNEIVGGRDTRIENLYINKYGESVLLFGDRAARISLKSRGLIVRPKKVTNFERIKAMGPCDMAEFLEELSERSTCEYCARSGYNTCPDETCPTHCTECVNGHYEWLMQETKDD